MALISYGRLKVRDQNGQKGMNINISTLNTEVYPCAAKFEYCQNVSSVTRTGAHYSSNHFPECNIT